MLDTLIWLIPEPEFQAVLLFTDMGVYLSDI